LCESTPPTRTARDPGLRAKLLARAHKHRGIRAAFRAGVVLCSAVAHACWLLVYEAATPAQRQVWLPVDAPGAGLRLLDPGVVPINPHRGRRHRAVGEQPRRTRAQTVMPGTIVNHETSTAQMATGAAQASAVEPYGKLSVRDIRRCWVARSRTWLRHRHGW
jgi:hypothetical protein